MDVSVHLGLPPLVGSDRQVAWANSLRVDGLTPIAEESGRLALRLRDGDQAGFARQLADECLDTALAHTAASWWIGHQGTVFVAVRAELSAEQKARIATAAHTDTTTRS